MKRIIIRKHSTSTSIQSDPICHACDAQVIKRGNYGQLLGRLGRQFLTQTGSALPSTVLCLKCIKFNLDSLQESIIPKDIQPKPDSLYEFPPDAKGIVRNNCFFTNVVGTLFTLIQNRIQITLPNVEIIKIERSYNKMLLSRFQNRLQNLFPERYVEGVVCSMDFKFDHPYGLNYMFHGSTNQAYDNIFDTGFDINFSKSTGLLGKGIYFAEDANYSDGYAELVSTDIAPLKVMLLCRVVLGTKIEQGRSGITTTDAHSVRGSALQQDHDIYAVFNNFQAYPEFIVYYKMI